MGVGARAVERYDRVLKFAPGLGPAMSRGQLDSIAAERLALSCLIELMSVQEFKARIAEFDKLWKRRNRKPPTGGKPKRKRREGSDER